MVTGDRSERHNDAAALVGGSGLVRAVERFFEGVARAWGSSRVRAGLAAVAPSTNADRVRFIGWVVGSAAATHIGLVGFARLLAPPLSGIGWLLAVPLAVACIVRPDAVAASWVRLRRRRSGRGATE